MSSLAKPKNRFYDSFILSQLLFLAIGVNLGLVCMGCQSNQSESLQPFQSPRTGMTLDQPPTFDPTQNSGPSDPSSPSPTTMAPRPSTPSVPRLDQFEPSPPVWTRLTASQYHRTLTLFLGFEPPALLLEEDSNPYLFYTIGGSTTTISAQGVERYMDAAQSIADRWIADPTLIETRWGCFPQTLTDSCLDSLIRSIGLFLFRRPLEESEVTLWKTLSQDYGENQVEDGLKGVLMGMLQSVHFLYRFEQGIPVEDHPHLRQYTSFEMASRLSFLLTNQGPDLELLQAAQRGELRDDESLMVQIDRLLQTPQAKEATQDFFAQYLDLKRLEIIELDPQEYEGFSPWLLKSMETEIKLLVDDLVYRQKGDLRRLYSEARGYVNQDLADLYGISVEGASMSSFIPVEFDSSIPRAGILGLGAFLTMNAHPTETSPTLRGKYIRERILCQIVPAPPDDIDLNLNQNPQNPQTLRERLELHRQDPACMGCHSYIDPPGFLFEHFDSMGRYREEAEGYPIDASGDLDGTPLNSIRELGAFLGQDTRVMKCLVRQVHRYASSRLDTVAEGPFLEAIQTLFAQGQYRFDALIKALVLSPTFRYVGHPQEEGMP